VEDSVCPAQTIGLKRLTIYRLTAEATHYQKKMNVKASQEHTEASFIRCSYKCFYFASTDESSDCQEYVGCR
jgi:hypothetical protein